MAIKDLLKNRRLELGLTLEQVAEKIGTSRQTIQRYETGVISNIPSDKIEALAEVLQTTPQHLMGWEDKKEVPDTYYDDEAKQIAQVLYERPELKTLFKTTQKVTAEDLKVIQQMVDVFAKRNED